MIALVTADKYFIDDITYRLRDMDIEPREFYSTVAGEATYALSQDERDKTAMLIDIGYLCTDVMVMEGDALIFHKCLDIGGGHISADIAEQLNIPFPFVEEKIKQTYSFNSTNQDETYVIPATEDEPARTVRRDEVTPIIEAKVEEIAEAINKALEEGGVKLGKWSNVYLTGGGLILNKGGKDFLAGQTPPNHPGGPAHQQQNDQPCFLQRRRADHPRRDDAGRAESTRRRCKGAVQPCIPLADGLLIARKRGIQGKIPYEHMSQGDAT